MLLLLPELVCLSVTDVAIQRLPALDRLSDEVQGVPNINSRIFIKD